MKTRIKISHECPIAMLEQSRKWNDYSYCLVHLLEKYPIYKQFFVEERQVHNRGVILDNSIFELGVSFDSDKFIEAINEIQPTEYIVPDVLEDCDGTIAKLDEFLSKKHKIKQQHPMKMIGVVQGKNFSDIIRCYKALDKYVDKIAISFDYSLYEKWVDNFTAQTDIHLNKHHKWMYGRPLMIEALRKHNIINKNKPHHLLGCSLPQEGISYGINHLFIESVDTSSPVVHALRGIAYYPFGLLEKNTIKLADQIEETTWNQSILDYNIYTFKKFWRGM